MQSTSASDGTYKLVITFKVGTDLDMAQVLVQNRVATAVPQLPLDVQKQGAVTKKVSTAILQVVNLYSPDGRYDSLFLSNYAWINLRDVIARLPGVGDVTVFGAGQYSMRVWLDPEMLKTLGLDPSDVVSAIQQQNLQVAGRPAGHAARARGPELPVPGQRGRPAGRGRGVREHHRQDRDRPGRPDHPGQGRRPRRAGRPELQPVLQLRRPAERGGRHLPAARRQRAAGRRRGRAGPWTSSAAASPRACPTPSPSTPPSSRGPRSTRSTRPSTRPPRWCCWSSWSSCRTGARRSSRRRPCR